MDAWSRRWTVDSWDTYLNRAQDESNLVALRDCTYSGRPLGSADFTRGLEKEADRPLTPQKRGPKRKPEPSAQQTFLSFDPF
jgi:hypothetical protein